MTLFVQSNRLNRPSPPPRLTARHLLGADSMAGLEEHANEKLQADAKFTKLMEKAGELVVPGSGHSVILRKIN